MSRCMTISPVSDWANHVGLDLGPYTSAQHLSQGHGRDSFYGHLGPDCNYGRRRQRRLDRPVLVDPCPLCVPVDQRPGWQDVAEAAQMLHQTTQTVEQLRQAARNDPVGRLPFFNYQLVNYQAFGLVPPGRSLEAGTEVRTGWATAAPANAPRLLDALTRVRDLWDQPPSATLLTQLEHGAATQAMLGDRHQKAAEKEWRVMATPRWSMTRSQDRLYCLLAEAPVLAATPEAMIIGIPSALRLQYLDGQPLVDPQVSVEDIPLEDLRNALMVYDPHNRDLTFADYLLATQVA